jgi:hypothetical protein
MPDLDERLSDELAATGLEVSLGTGFPGEVAIRVSRRHRRRRAALLLSMVVALCVGAGALIQLRAGDDDSTLVAGPGPAPVFGAGVWTPMPEGPLSPRRDALAFTVGDEALIFGGWSGPGCSPTSSCRDVAPLVDGAAYDPVERTWRSIADTPLPLQRASGAVVGDRLYLWASTYCPPRATCVLEPFMVYDVGDDEWTRLSLPPEVGAGVRLAAFDDEVVAYGRASGGESVDFVYSPADETWTAIPPVPPEVPSSDRKMVAHGADLYLFGLGLTPPGAHGAAVLRGGDDEWTVLDDGGDLGYGTTWAPIGDLIVNPGGPIETDPIPTAEGEAAILGHGDGGALDTTDDSWEALPAPPREPPDFQDLGTVAGPDLIVTDGMVFDVAERTWTPLPQTETVTGTGAAVTWVDDTLVAWGGTGLEPMSIGATFTPAEATTPSTEDALPPGNVWRRVEPVEALDDSHVVRVRDLVVDPGDPSVVLARFPGDSCASVRAIVEVQDDHLVRIRVESGRQPSPPAPVVDACAGVGQPQEIAVPLDDPVGDRALRSVPGGTTGPSWHRIEPTEDLVGARTTRVAELVADPEEPSSVLAHFMGGVPDCIGARAVVERQDREVVRIRVETGEVPGLNDGDPSDLHLCASVGFDQELVVALDAPLGDRELRAVPAER